MSKSKYENTVSKIKASDELKKETISKLKASLDNEDHIYNRKIRYDYRKFASLAACLIFVITIGVTIKLFNNNENKLVNDTNKPPDEEEIVEDYFDSDYFAGLPKLDVFYEFGGMGFGAYMAYNIDELKTSNPWTLESDLKTMPVFKNKVDVSVNAGVVSGGLSGDEMLNKGKKVAQLMKLSVNESYTLPTEEDNKMYEEKTGEKPNTNPYMASIKCDEVEINVDSLGRVNIYFNKAKKIPGKYSFTFNKTNAEQAEETTKYLLNEYSEILGLKSAEISIFGDFTYNGERSFRYNLYEGDGSLIDKILNYNFNYVSFGPTDNGGELGSIYLNSTDLSNLIGNYPIINADEAKVLLSNGEYITSVPKEVENLEYVASIELIYLNSSTQEVFMPYYQFLIEIPSMKLENGLKTYGIYYVPAIKSEYITNMPKYDGSFN